VKKTHPKAKIFMDGRVVFNIKANDFRLVALVQFVVIKLSRRNLQLPLNRLKARLFAQGIQERVGLYVNQTRIPQSPRYKVLLHKMNMPDSL
jgi:hypothetical protein